MPAPFLGFISLFLGPPLGVGRHQCEATEVYDRLTDDVKYKKRLVDGF